MFKKCNLCQSEWASFQDFTNDKNLRFIGYQAHFNKPDEGLFLFNHMNPDCMTTMSLKINVFFEPLNFYGKMGAFEPHGPGCTGNCADESNLDACKNKLCNGRSLRELIQKLTEKMSKK